MHNKPLRLRCFQNSSRRALIRRMKREHVTVLIPQKLEIIMKLKSDESKRGFMASYDIRSIIYDI
jgi:hypothetical protein